MMPKEKGVPALVLATGVYGLYGVFSRMIGLEFGVFTQNWLRNFLVAATLFVYVTFAKKWIRIRKEDFLWILFWILSGMFSTLALFISFNILPIGVSYFVTYVGIIISGSLVGLLLFKEAVNKIKLFSIFLALLGLVIIFHTSLNLTNLLLVVPLISGAFTGIWYTISKKFSNRYPNIQLVFLDATVGGIFSFLLTLFFREHLPQFTFTISWTGIALFALAQLVTVQLVVYGFKHTTVHLGTIIMPLETVFGAFFAFLFFKEVLSSATFIGGILILFAAIMPYIHIAKTK